MAAPKVLVGCPTFSGMEYALSDYAAQVKRLVYDNYDVVLVDNSPDDQYKKKLESLGFTVVKGPYVDNVQERVVASRNLLRQYAVDKNYDFLLILEQDVIPPRRVIQALLRHKKPVMTGVYYKPFTLNIKFANGKVVKKKSIRPVLYRFIPGVKDKLHFCTKKDVMGDFLFRVAASGLGCVLIHKDVFSKIPFRTDGKSFDDNFFCEDLRNKNIPLFVDTSMKCKHLLLKKPQ
ncbi:MAG: hypothetical protein Q7R56_02050 [Nanoarchaeota archaeon]|nr:hypothetical protein [Nanoarchaeota archaeon]